MLWFAELESVTPGGRWSCIGIVGSLLCLQSLDMKWKEASCNFRYQAEFAGLTEKAIDICKLYV